MLLETPKSDNSFKPKGIISSLFHNASPQNAFSPSHSLPTYYSPSSPKQHTFSVAMMEENIDNAEKTITKWDLTSSSYTKLTFLFQDSRKDATEFIKSVKELRRAMHYLVAENSASSKLVLAQKLMQTAMKRLEKEFYQILSKNRDHLNPESISSRSSVGSSSFGEEDDAQSNDELEILSESVTEVKKVSEIAMSDLKSIADCMIVCGYGKECVKIYKVIRKSIIDEGLYGLRIERFKSSQVQKLNWEALVGTIKNWINAIKIAVKTLFNGEKILCDHVFSASVTIKDSCFYEITKAGAIDLFKFPELIARSHKKSPERIFQLMELYEAFSELLPDIESIFSSESTSAIRSQALSSSLKLRDSIPSILQEFESKIQKNSSKTLIFGGGIHPVTQSVVDYISSLADHSGVLSGILAHYPPPGNSPLNESFFESLTTSSDSPAPDAASVHLAWLILVLLCKLDCKAELYKDVSLSYLFLANNLNFIVEKVRTTNLRFLLGDEWISKHTKKVHQYTLSYETMAWTKALSSLPDNNASSPLSTEMVKESLRKFNAAFEEAYKKQASWIVQDGKLRDELKVSIANKLVPKYRQFYDANLDVLCSEEKNSLQLLVRFSPDDLGNYLSDLFHGASNSGSSKSSSSSSLSPHRCLSR
ncbi:Exocyst complex component 7 [Morus notabilis]|uniref:Exocyst subunit Exo70 family protein n=1 Tax=Morus notabilis TaxID=981085 RepID=W9RAM2_9ROSA|nr:exocyst complex component EXO70H1 [Morus notabilis]EXB65359.1 Exocyst complex component 7 [Morus notabilis]